MGQVIGVPDSPDEAYAYALRMLSDNFDYKAQIEQLNRTVASFRSENERLKGKIDFMRESGDADLIELNEQLADAMMGHWPRERAAHQRREIANLHKVIRRLKDEAEQR